MHYNTLFQDRNLKKNFWGGAQPLPRPNPTPRYLNRRIFGAPHLVLSALGFMCPVFSVPIVGNHNCD